MLPQASLLGILAMIGAETFAPAEATLLFAGDAMQHGPQLKAARQPDGSFDFDYCFTEVKPIVEEADYAIVNLETPVGLSTFSGYPQFSAPASYATALKNAGFDFILTANNHTVDRGHKGLKRTIEVLDSLGLPHVGTYVDSHARDSLLPMIKNVKGFKLGFLNYTYDTNGLPVTGGTVVDIIDRKQMADDIKRAREAGAEILIVSMHWGIEYQMLPPAQVRQLADFLKNQGVDIINGGHPHVIEPMELEHNPAIGRNTALIYSLGNFISNQQQTDSRGGAMAKVTLKRDSAGTAYVDSLAYRLVFVVPKGHDSPNYKLYPAEMVDNPAWNSTRDRFVSNATAIFNKHNVNVTSW